MPANNMIGTLPPTYQYNRTLTIQWFAIMDYSSHGFDITIMGGTADRNIILAQ